MDLYVKILIAYTCIINLVGLSIMGIDKQKARNNAWRIKEATLFTVALIGGGLGCTMGMYTFRHKTKHWYFVLGMPAIMIVNLIIFYFLIRIAL